MIAISIAYCNGTNRSLYPLQQKLKNNKQKNIRKCSMQSLQWDLTFELSVCVIHHERMVGKILESLTLY